MHAMPARSRSEGRPGSAGTLLLLLLCASLSGLADARRRPTTEMPRKEVDLFVGVQTGFSYRYRRDVLRNTWFPRTPEDIARVEDEQGIAMRFVIGYTLNPRDMMALTRETKEFGGFLRIPHLESYHSLTAKTHNFFKFVLRLYRPKYLLKIDDDVYLQLPRLGLLIPQYEALHKDYIGCFMRNTPVISDESQGYPQWIEPQHSLLGERYITYARGSAYFVSAQALGWIASMPPRSLRYFRSEDVTVGMWMASFNATPYDDPRLCSSECSNTSVIVYEKYGCTNCDPSKLIYAMYDNDTCLTEPAGNDEGFIPLEASPVDFLKMTEEGEVLPLRSLRRRRLGEVGSGGVGAGGDGDSGGGSALHGGWALWRSWWRV